MKASRKNRLARPIVGAVVFCGALLMSLGCPKQHEPDAKPQAKPIVEPKRDESSEPERPTTEKRVEPPRDPATENKAPANKQPAAEPTSDGSTSEKPSDQVGGKPAPRAADAGDSGRAAQPGDPLFKNWPKPEAVVVATGMQMGYVEPCGCSGRENQKGGLSRRHNLIKKLVADGWNVVPVDVGGQIHRYGKQSELKFQATIDALKTMHYQAVALGADDLRLPADVLTAAVVEVDKENPSPFVSANAALFGFDQPFMPRMRIIPAGKQKIGVTAVLGESERKTINNSDIQTKSADEAIKEILPDLKAAKCDHLLLLAHATRDEATALAKQFPEFDLIVFSGGAAVPPREPELVPGTKTRLIEVGEKGMAANVIGLFDDPKQPLRFQAVTLDAKFDKIEIAGKLVGPSEEMRQMLASYQDQLKLMGLSGLNLKPAAHPSGAEFVGSKACGECHTKAYAIWSKTPHAHALDTLVKQTPPRQFDPECLSCHVTGWSPQKFHPFKGGYESLQKTPLLAQNGCENCHGPGSAHIAAENGAAPAGQDLAGLRALMRVPATAKTCIECHDGDNSINFNFDAYWPKVAHEGKD